MKKAIKTTSVLTAIIGFVIVVIGSSFSIIYGIIGMVVFLVSISVFTICGNKDVEWKCTECDNIFRVSLFKSVIGINMGIGNKMLYCKECHKYVLCNRINK